MADLEFEELCCQEESLTLCDPAYKLVHDILSDSDDSDSGICNEASLQPVSQNRKKASIEIHSKNSIRRLDESEDEKDLGNERKASFTSSKKNMRLNLIKDYKSSKSEFKSLADELFETLNIVKEEKLRCLKDHVCQNENACDNKYKCQNEDACRSECRCQNKWECQKEHSHQNKDTNQEQHKCQNENTCRAELSAGEMSNSFLQMSDSGNSTLHSPDTFQAGILPYYRILESPANDSELECSCSSRSASSGSLCHWQLLDATHRALHTFIARHSDELELTIGDPIYVQKEAEDLWCEGEYGCNFRQDLWCKGINLRSGFRGIFPSAYVVDVEYNDFNGDSVPVKKERYLVNYMGSLETNYQKGGESVIFQAINKITRARKQVHVYSCILEVSDRGVRMLERPKNNESDSSECLDYFYSLKNVICCAFHPYESSYMGFITKHPQCDRFACHVLHSTSTKRCVEAIGRAFDKFYSKFIEKAYPTEDIYIE